MQNSRNYKRCIGLLCVLILVLCMAGDGWATDMTEERVGASSDDAHELNNGNVNITFTYLDLDASSTYGGLRFTTVPLPQGATITTASIALRLYTTSHDSPDFDIFAEDTASGTTFTTDNNNISGRTPTSASVTWSAADLGTGWKTSPEIKTVIQEIVDRGDWSENNDLVFLLDRNFGCDVWPFTYDQSSIYGAKFNCSYTVGPPPSGQVIIIGAKEDFHRPPRADLEWRGQ